MSTAPIEPIGAVLGRLLGGGQAPARAPAGIAQRPVHYRPDRRARPGTIDRAQRKATRARRRCERKAERIARGLSPRSDFIQRALIDLLRRANDDFDLTFNLTYFAKCWRTDARCIRRHLARWEKQRYVDRVHSVGGRGCRGSLRLRVKSARFEALARWYGLPKKNSDILPSTPIQRDASSAGLRPVQRTASPMSENPSAEESRQDWRRLKRIEPGEFQASARQFRALMRYFRLKCWQRGLSFAASQRLTAALGSEVGRVGKWSKREYLVTAASVWLRGQKAEELERLSFPAMRAIAARGFPAAAPAAALEKTLPGAARPGRSRPAAARQLPLFAAKWLKRITESARKSRAG